MNDDGIWPDVSAGASAEYLPPGERIKRRFSEAELLDSLSPQEHRVIAQVAAGFTNKEIARLLQLSDKTVKNYLSNAFQKLQVRRRSRAAALFSRRHRA